MKILGKTYQIEYVDADIIENLGADGACVTHKGKIYISDELHEDDLRETKIHEVLHAIWAGMDIGYSESTEEKIVTALAKGLAAFISDNHSETIQEIFK